MSQTISIDQVADYIIDGIARWTVENIIVELDMATQKWSYYELVWNEYMNDWNQKPLVSRRIAAERCDITLPRKFYT